MQKRPPSELEGRQANPMNQPALHAHVPIRIIAIRAIRNHGDGAQATRHPEHHTGRHEDCQWCGARARSA